MWRDRQPSRQEIPLSDQITHSKTICIQPVLDYELSHGLWDLLSIQSVKMIHSYMLLPAFSGNYVCTFELCMQSPQKQWVAN